MALLQSPQFIIGNQTTRYTLAATYTGSGISSAYDVKNAVKLYLDVEYTMGTGESSNSIEVKVEFADPLVKRSTPVTADWYQTTNEADGGGTTTLTLQEYTFAAVSAAATYDRFVIDLTKTLKNIGHHWIRVSVKETGKASNFGNASVKLVKVEEESIN